MGHANEMLSEACFTAPARACIALCVRLPLKSCNSAAPHPLHGMQDCEHHASRRGRGIITPLHTPRTQT